MDGWMDDDWLEASHPVCVSIGHTVSLCVSYPSMSVSHVYRYHSLCCVYPHLPAPAPHHRSSLQHARGMVMDKEGKNSDGLTVVGVKWVGSDAPNTHFNQPAIRSHTNTTRRPKRKETDRHKATPEGGGMRHRQTDGRQTGRPHDIAIDSMKAQRCRHTAHPAHTQAT